MHAESLQSCPTLSASMDYSLPGSSLSMGFSRQEYWSGLPCPPPEDLPNPGTESTSRVCNVLNWVKILYPLSHRSIADL